MYSPRVKSAKCIRKYRLVPFTFQLFSEIESLGSIEYLYILAIYRDGSEHPRLFVTSEKNILVFGGDSHFLCLFTDSSHINMGASDDWANLDRFITEALLLATKHLGLSDIPVLQSEARWISLGTALTAEIAFWEDDPMSVPEAYTIRVPIPELDTSPLAIRIVEEAPLPAIYVPGTREFRYWTAAAALGRAVDYWRNLLPGVTDWEVGPVLTVRLDAGEGLDAYYTRDEDQKGLSFFHKTIHGQTIYSGESSDMICCMLGYAILDTIRPDLWDMASDEISAFYASFADISAILSNLQLRSLREAVLIETNGDLQRSSRLSRMDEQLGWAIRQANPNRTDSDCLRNAVNSFIYQDPTCLPPLGPNSMLTSEPDSFSRVFTGGFFEALANMTSLQSPTPTERDLLKTSQDAGKLLVAALQAAPATPDFYSQVAAHMLEADRLHFKKKYRTVLVSAFVRRRILSLKAIARMRY
jgi:hypothetical protein